MVTELPLVLMLETKQTTWLQKCTSLNLKKPMYQNKVESAKHITSDLFP